MSPPPRQSRPANMFVAGTPRRQWYLIIAIAGCDRGCAGLVYLSYDSATRTGAAGLRLPAIIVAVAVAKGLVTLQPNEAGLSVRKLWRTEHRRAVVGPTRSMQD